MSRKFVITKPVARKIVQEGSTFETSSFQNIRRSTDNNKETFAVRRDMPSFQVTGEWQIDNVFGQWKAPGYRINSVGNALPTYDGSGQEWIFMGGVAPNVTYTQWQNGETDDANIPNSLNGQIVRAVWNGRWEVASATGSPSTTAILVGTTTAAWTQNSDRNNPISASISGTTITTIQSPLSKSGDTIASGKKIIVYKNGSSYILLNAEC